MVDHAVVKVLAAQMRVAGRGLDFKDAVFDCENGDIEGTAAEVKDEHVTLHADLLVEAVRDGGCGGFVDDTQHVHARDGAGIFSGLALGVIEVSRHCDHTFAYSLQNRQGQVLTLKC